ncbi:hypothetical protein AVEN_95551-1 [Araneus ventricosus]|uniref:Uncharacterized protein n=1 Tax=Araneus ventricosus TaxID=182803 RepID=A0A4Y2HBB0_ARAVE|nr:hypothetical protein AVEN_95551-1 [Araneus ventricosus]
MLLWLRCVDSAEDHEFQTILGASAGMPPRYSCRGSGKIDWILTSIWEVEHEASFSSGATATVQSLSKGAKVTREGE